MAGVQDIAIAQASPATASAADTIILPTGIVTVEIQVPGLQGPPGLQNVYVQSTQPVTPPPAGVGTIWIQV